VKPIRCLFLCTTPYNASALREVALALPGWDCRFAPFYSQPTAAYRQLLRAGLIDKTPLAAHLHDSVVQKIRQLGLLHDRNHVGGLRDYDLVVLGNDFFIPQDLRGFYPKVLVQEGWVWPFAWRRRVVASARLPSILASANGSGLSHKYTYFCVASEGYREAFAPKIPLGRMVVTGLPLLDRVRDELGSFVDRSRSVDYVLLATHPGREYYEGERRLALLKRTRAIAAGRRIVVKFHPQEKQDRARREVEKVLPEAMVAAETDVRPLIANCAALVTTYSTVIFYAMLMNKPVFSSYSEAHIEKLLPEQNGDAASRIAAVCRRAIERRTGDI